MHVSFSRLKKGGNLPRGGSGDLTGKNSSAESTFGCWAGSDYVGFFLKSCFLWQRFAWKPVTDIHFEQIRSRLRCNVRFPYLSVSFTPPDCWLQGKQKWVN